MNFAEILDIAADRHPAGEAISLDDRSLSYEELRRRARTVSARLAQDGVGPGDRVGVVMFNALEFTEIAFGIIGMGAILVPVNPRLSASEMVYILNHAGARMLFIGRDHFDYLDQISREIPAIEKRYLVAHGVPADLRVGGPGDADYEEIFAGQESLTRWVELDPADDCMIVYTSGTTGRPKGAVRSHGSAMWGAVNFLQAMGQTDHQRHRFLYPVPLASVAFIVVFVPCLFAGIPVTLSYRYDPLAVAETIVDKRVTHTYMVPSMWGMLVEAVRNASRAWPEAWPLEVGIWGGEAFPPKLREDVISRFGPIVTGVFGATEAALSAAQPGDDATHPGTSGRAAGFSRFRIIDDRGNEVARGDRGELLCRGGGVMTGYYDNPEATQAVLEGGWYKTGDIAYMDDEGFIYVVDRKKEMLISGGQNVYPAEIERVLCEEPGVVAAAVIGVPSERWGEMPMAFVVPSNSGNLDEETLSAALSEKLAKYKVPKRWEFVDELPKNSNGKVMKAELRRIAREA